MRHIASSSLKLAWTRLEISSEGRKQASCSCSRHRVAHDERHRRSCCPASRGCDASHPARLHLLNNQCMLPSNEGLTRHVLSLSHIDLWKRRVLLFRSISANSLVGHHFTEESVPKCLDNPQRISCLRCQPKALKSCSHPEAIWHHSSYWSAFHGAQNHSESTWTNSSVIVVIFWCFLGAVGWTYSNQRLWQLLRTG